MFDTSDQLEVFPTTVDLKRVDPALNMRRFYRLTIQRDLFGGASLVREWGRIGFRGQSLVEPHQDEGRAMTALLKLAATKRRRGYVAGHEPWASHAAR
ncbi:WGR domain-containing protein [Thioclava sp. GXIMD4215]|uniref:WGR domain-containing protein n=1 Tax=Thioclava sp. GXIMD4215 TaxID=3131928 RepID=UPI00311B2465